MCEENLDQDYVGTSSTNTILCYILQSVELLVPVTPPFSNPDPPPLSFQTGLTPLAQQVLVEVIAQLKDETSDPYDNYKSLGPMAQLTSSYSHQAMKLCKQMKNVRKAFIFTATCIIILHKTQK